MVDFKVLDYQEDVGFIYAYKTPYYGPNDESEGLTVSAVGDVGDGEALETRTATETQDTSLWSRCSCPTARIQGRTMYFHLPGE